MNGQFLLKMFLPATLGLPLVYVLSLLIGLGIKFLKVGIDSPGLFLLPSTVSIFNLIVLIFVLISAVLWKRGKVSWLVFLLPGIAGLIFNLCLLLKLFGISAIQAAT